MVEKNNFYEKKKISYYKNINFCTKGMFILRRKKGFMNVSGLWITGSKGISFLTQEIGR